MSTDEVHRWAAQERERDRKALPEQKRQIEGVPQYKHIPGLPWGDPTSYVKASTTEELEQAREALNKSTAEKHEREAQLVLEQERRRLAEEKREQEAREYLVREAERVVKEREGNVLSEGITMGEGVVIHLAHPVRERVESGDVVVVGLIIYDIKRDELRCLPPDRGIAKDCWRDILLKFLVPTISAPPE
jgi:hypothetical protein